VSITLLIALKGISQTSSDTTCLPNTQLKKVINRLETCKVIEEELNTTKEQVVLLNKRVSLKDSIINRHELQGRTYAQIIDNYTRNVNNLENVVSNLKVEVNLQRRAIRRQKLTKWISGLIGIGVGVLISK
jgi:hypothetical protein